VALKLDSDFVSGVGFMAWMTFNRTRVQWIWFIDAIATHRIEPK